MEGAAAQRGEKGFFFFLVWNLLEFLGGNCGENFERDFVETFGGDYLDLMEGFCWVHNCTQTNKQGFQNLN